jgi:hypothetical protein
MKEMSTGRLKHYHRNPRRGDVNAVAESLKEFGQFRPIIVNKGTKTGRRNEVLAGNHTLKAARQLGWTSIQVEMVDVDDGTAAKIVVADNRTADKAGYDSGLLLQILQELPETTGTGYNGDDISDLLIEAQQNITPAELTDTEKDEADRWEQASRRSLIIEYPLAQFAWVVEKLHDLATGQHVTSNAAMAQHLLEEYTK